MLVKHAPRWMLALGARPAGAAVRALAWIGPPHAGSSLAPLRRTLPMRFGVRKRSLPGITQHMLTEQLKELALNGIVIRRAYAEIPPRVEYELSQAGIDLIPTLREMLEWSLKYDALLNADPPGETPHKERA